MKLNLTLAEAIKAMTDKKVPGIATANIRYHEFYDRQPYAQAGQNAIQFFGRNPSTISDDDSNLRTGKSELSSSQCFIVCAISTHLEPGADATAYGVGGTAAAIDDYIAFVRSGRLVFKTGSREDYVENGPLGRFPPATQLMLGGVGSDSSTAGAGQRTLIQHAAMEGGIYEVTPKIIMPGDAFEFSAKWSTPVAVSVAGRIDGRLYGYLADLR